MGCFEVRLVLEKENGKPESGVLQGLSGRAHGTVRGIPNLALVDSVRLWVPCREVRWEGRRCNLLFCAMGS